MIQSTNIKLIAERARHLEQWLADEAPYVSFDQKHLDGGTPEQAYWHLGYLAALRDAMSLINDDTGDKPGSAIDSPASGSDE